MLSIPVIEGIVFVYIFRAISFAGHSNEYSQFAYLQQLIRCFLFANVNESYKSCSELNSLQKFQMALARISIFPRTGVRALQSLPFLKNFNVLEWERRFSLEPNAAKNTCYIKKCLKQKLFRIKFYTKNLWTHISISPRSGPLDAKHLPFLKQIAMYWNGRIGSLWG